MKSISLQPEIRGLFYCLAFLLSIPLFTQCHTSKTTMEPMEIRVTDTIFVSESIEEPEIESPAKYQATFERSADLLHTELELAFDYSRRAVMGTARLTLTPLFYPIDYVQLDAKTFEIESTKLYEKELDHTYDGKQVKVMLDKTYERGDTIQLVIQYTAFPYREASGGSAAILSDRGLYFIDPDQKDPYKPTQIWTQGETESSSRWFPTIDKPNERCTQEVHLLVDTMYETLSNGLLTSSVDHGNGQRTDTWTMTKPHAPYLFMLTIADLHRAEDEWKGIPLEYLVEHEYANDASHIFAHTPEMLTYFSDVLDYQYPWDKYSQVIVRDYVSGAMENTTASLYGQFLQRPAGDLIDNGNDKIVAHEMFHQWFGDLVTCESWSNLTLNEGFANYSEYLWLAHKYGVDEGEQHRYSELQGYLGQANQYAHPLIDFHYEDKEDMFDAHSYNKGGLVLHMLRHLVGDQAFFASLNHYLNTKEYEAAEVHDLRLAFEEVTGLDLNWFFNQWFLEPGHPVIDMSHSYSKESGFLTLTVKQTQADRGWPTFVIPTEVEFYCTDGSIVSKSILLDSLVNVFYVELTADVELVLLDPKHIQLMEMVRPMPASLMLYEKSSSVWDRLRSLRSIDDQDEEEDVILVGHGLIDPFYMVRQQTIIKGATFPQVQSKLAELAVNDPHANVRVAAIQQLAEVESSLINKLLTDKSTNVIAAAAMRLNEIDTVKAMNWANKNQDSPSQSILQSVADIYVDHEVKNKEDFFRKSADRMSFQTLFPFYTTWAGNLVYEDPEVVKDQLTQWSDQIQSEDTDIYKKYAILTALQPLSQYLPVDKYSEEDKSEIQGLMQKIGMAAMKLMNQG